MDIFLIISWFVAGFFSMMYVWIRGMRNKEYDKNYFSCENILISIILLFSGYVSVVIIYFVFVHVNKPFTKLIYKIANIGIKRKDSDTN